MENQNDKKNDCGCDSGCCQPKKSKLWAKLLFILVFLAASVIIIVKVTGKSNEVSEQKCDTTLCSKQSGKCDTASQGNIVQITNPSQEKPCCPGGKK